MAATGTSVVHCPDSNYQLMSGLFDAKFTQEMGVNISLGTDIGKLFVIILNLAVLIGASGLLGLSEQICMAERVSKCRAINSKSDQFWVFYELSPKP